MLRSAKRWGLGPCSRPQVKGSVANVHPISAASSRFPPGSGLAGALNPMGRCVVIDGEGDKLVHRELGVSSPLAVGDGNGAVLRPKEAGSELATLVPSPGSTTTDSHHRLGCR